MDSSLLRALRVVIRADSDPLRQSLFASMKEGHVVVSIVSWLHARLGRTWAGAMLVSGYGVGSFLGIAGPRHHTGRIVAIAVHVNARRQIERLAGWIAPYEIGWVRTGAAALRPPASLTRVLGGRRWLQSLRVVHRVNKRHDFLISCRVASTLACYARARAILTDRAVGMVVVSSDSNPEEIGFACAARRQQIPVLFISHAYTTPISPPLDFALSLLEGPAALNAHRQKGAVKGAVLLVGVEGESVPMDARRLLKTNPAIGVFAPKLVAWPRFAALIEDCRRRFHAREVLIRWHPSMLETPWLSTVLADTTGIVETKAWETLPDVARRCDWVVADLDSNVHLPVLKLGIPTIAVRQLGVCPESRSNLYGFVANRIIPPPVSALGEMSPDAAVTFYSEGWADRFHGYDASYLQSQDVIVGEVREAVRRLLEEDVDRTHPPRP